MFYSKAFKSSALWKGNRRHGRVVAEPWRIQGLLLYKCIAGGSSSNVSKHESIKCTTSVQVSQFSRTWRGSIKGEKIFIFFFSVWLFLLKGNFFWKKLWYGVKCSNEFHPQSHHMENKILRFSNLIFKCHILFKFSVKLLRYSLSYCLKNVHACAHSTVNTNISNLMK